MSLFLRLRSAARAQPCLRSSVSLVGARPSAPVRRCLIKHDAAHVATPLIRPLCSTARSSFRTCPPLRVSSNSTIPPPPPPPSPPPSESDNKKPDEESATTSSTGATTGTQTVHENVYTIPNLLTVSRIVACPFIGYAILHDQFWVSTSLLAYASFSDWLDGYLARRYNMRSVVGTILDPAADKALMTTLTVTLAMKDLIPVPLAVIILGRDVLLSLSAFYIRYTSLPEPKTFSRYWDFSIPSAEVRPTQISKYNTALQLLLMFTAATSPVIPLDLSTGLTALEYIVATTTIWSGLSYIFSKDAYRVVATARKLKNGPPRPPT